MSDVKSILEELHISPRFAGYWDGDVYVIEPSNSTEWGTIEAKLDAGEQQGVLEKLDEECEVTVEGATTVYTYQDSCTFTLLADFDADEYTLRISTEE